MSAGDGRSQDSAGRRAVSVCGIGGQGVVLAGVILGEAAMRSGMWACQSAAYTVAARGGFARSEVIIGSAPQACPLAEELDLVVALADEGWELERPRLAADAVAVLDEAVTQDQPDPRLIRAPLARMAKEAGRPRSANLVGLGFLAGLTALVPKESLLEAIEANLGRVSGDLAAFEAGFAAGSRHLDEQEEKQS